MPQIEDYVVEVITSVKIRNRSGAIVEEFRSRDSGKATTHIGTSLKGRTEVLLARTAARIIEHVKVAEINEAARLSHGH